MEQLAEPVAPPQSTPTDGGLVTTAGGLRLTRLEDWGIVAKGSPLIVAGPCSAESEEQVLTTARKLADQGVPIFRAGVWKPRTRPGSFEGVGSVALSWLRKVKRETGMLTAVEVANVRHVYEALKMGIDILWIGARTTVNPFTVQEIADALQGVDDVPVLVKNPMNPSVELWLGAIERVNQAGVTRIAAVHRGFTSIGQSPYRNPPQWHVPIEIRRREPELPMLCDPSHIAGAREPITGICQCALDLGFNGLMIESHCDPASALSDADQQLTPSDLGLLLEGLVLRQDTASDSQVMARLREFRMEIDRLDSEVMALLARRMTVVDSIGHLKRDNGMTVLQTTRWNEVIERARQRGNEYGLSSQFTEKIFHAIHEESIAKQEEILNG